MHSKGTSLRKNRQNGCLKSSSWHPKINSRFVRFLRDLRHTMWWVVPPAWTSCSSRSSLVCLHLLLFFVCALKIEALNPSPLPFTVTLSLQRAQNSLSTKDDSFVQKRNYSIKISHRFSRLGSSQSVKTAFSKCMQENSVAFFGRHAIFLACI